ncbi:hypothetical protein DSM21852_10460 [Methylocystis bryophila]|nr:hypothetical protein DSM21852_10460 [Methylocystis bryophila]
MHRLADDAVEMPGHALRAADVDGRVGANRPLGVSGRLVEERLDCGIGAATGVDKLPAPSR